MGSQGWKTGFGETQLLECKGEYAEGDSQRAEAPTYVYKLCHHTWLIPEHVDQPPSATTKITTQM